VLFRSAIYIVRQLQEKYTVKKKDWMAFVDHKKAFD